MINVNSRSRNSSSLDTTAPPAYKPSVTTTTTTSTSPAFALSSTAQDSLPDYCSGTEIKPLSPHVPATASSTSSPTVAVHLDQPARICDVDDIITGRIVFRPRRDCVLGTITATLAGKERTSKTHWVSQSTLQKSMRLAQHTVSPSAFPQGSIARKGFAYSFTFSMQVPLILQGSEHQCRCSRCFGGGSSSSSNDDKDGGHCENGQAAALIPPSLGSSPTEGQGYLEQPACVYYFISASVMTLCVSPDPSIPATIDSIYSCDCPPGLAIVPSYPNFPKTPSYAETTTTTTVAQANRAMTTKKVKASAEIRRGLLKSSAVGRVELALSDEPLILSADASDISYARFTLTFIPSARAACEVPPKLTNFVSKLVATTQYAVPSDDSSLDDASATSPTSTSTSNWDNRYYTETLPVAQLATHRPTWARHNHLGSASYYSCTLTLPLSLPYHRNTVPSFRSRYVQRSYRLKVSVGLGATSLAVWAPVCVTSSFVPKSYYSVPIVGSLCDCAMMMQQTGVSLQNTNATNGGTGCVHPQEQRQQSEALPVLVKATY